MSYWDHYWEQYTCADCYYLTEYTLYQTDGTERGGLICGEMLVEPEGEPIKIEERYKSWQACENFDPR